VLAALLEHVAPQAEIVDAIPWRTIRKDRAGDGASAEARNVLGLANRARDHGCDTVVFARDRDGSKQRQSDIAKGLEQAAEIFADLHVVGAVAIETIEAWVLALLGHPEPETVGKPKKERLDGHGIVSWSDMAAAVANARPDERVRACAPRLQAWLARAERRAGNAAR